MVGRSRIPEDSDAGEAWNRLLKQLKPLGAELGQHVREPSDVATRMGQALDNAGPYWIRDVSHDDGNGGCGTVDRLDCDRAPRDDHLDLAKDQVLSQLRYPSIIAVSGTPLDHYIASFGVASVPQSTAELLRL